MSHLLAKWIFPHFHNNHHPYALRHHSLFLFTILIALAQITANALVGDLKILGYATNITKVAIISLTNKERVSFDSPSLRENALLSQAAALKADDMFSKNYWAHFAPNGTSPWYFFSKVGYQYSWAGENLARDFQTSAGVVAGWMASSAGHKENLLNSNFTEIGVAVKNGVLQGEETTLVVQLFAKPVSYTASAPTSESQQPQPGIKATVRDKLAFPAEEANKSVSEGQNSETIVAEGISGKGKSPLNIAGTIENLSSSQKTSFGLLFVLGSLFVLDSAAIFRKKHRRTNSHSGLHASIIFILMVTLLAQSIGSTM